MNTTDRSGGLDTQVGRRRPDRRRAMTVDHVERDPLAVLSAQLVERPGGHGGTFGSVVCAVDGTANGQAARHQAELLASRDGTVEVVSASRLTRPGQRAVLETCEGHDLLALGAGPSAHAAVERAPIPILIARSCPLGTEVTDTIVVPVDASLESSCAVEVAARLAAAHGGTVTIAVAPPRDPVLQRAIVASERIVRRATGAPPRVLGEPRPPQRSVPSAAAALGASLVVLGFGRSESERCMAARMVGSFGCSVLAVPCWTDPSEHDPERPRSRQ
jgi:nucleotide-binding universal stress UspA family protein